MTTRTAKSATKTSRASATARSAAASSKSKASAAPTPDVVVTKSPNSGEPELKKKELIETVVARSGIKKRDAKPVIEAMLEVLGETISDGRDLNLSPMGKLKITRMKKTSKAQVITARLRRNDPKPESAPDPLAQAAE